MANPPCFFVYLCHKIPWPERTYVAALVSVIARVTDDARLGRRARDGYGRVHCCLRTVGRALQTKPSRTSQKLSASSARQPHRY
eukprot:scaffold2093_cov425-Prasinococcus_capsulatus_cf.AAC.13